MLYFHFRNTPNVVMSKSSTKGRKTSKSPGVLEKLERKLQVKVNVKGRSKDGTAKRGRPKKKNETEVPLDLEDAKEDDQSTDSEKTMKKKGKDSGERKQVPSTSEKEGNKEKNGHISETSEEQAKDAAADISDNLDAMGSSKTSEREEMIAGKSFILRPEFSPSRSDMSSLSKDEQLNSNISNIISRLSVDSESKLSDSDRVEDDKERKKEGSDSAVSNSASSVLCNDECTGFGVYSDLSDAIERHLKMRSDTTDDNFLSMEEWRLRHQQGSDQIYKTKTLDSCEGKGEKSGGAKNVAQKKCNGSSSDSDSSKERKGEKSSGAIIVTEKEMNASTDHSVTQNEDVHSGGAISVTEKEYNGSTKSGSSKQMENENNSGAEIVTEKQSSESIDFRVSRDKERAMDIKKITESDEDIAEIPYQKSVEVIDIISTSQSDSDNAEPATGTKETDNREVVRQARSPTAALWNQEKNPRPFSFGVVGGYPAIIGVRTDKEEYCQVQYVDEGTKMVPLQTPEKSVAHHPMNFTQEGARNTQKNIAEGVDHALNTFDKGSEHNEPQKGEENTGEPNTDNVTEKSVTCTDDESQTCRDVEPKGSLHNGPQNNGEKNIGVPNTGNVTEILVTCTNGESETSRDVEPKGSAHKEPKNDGEKKSRRTEKNIGETNTENVTEILVTSTNGESENSRDVEPKGSAHKEPQNNGEESIGETNTEKVIHRSVTCINGESETNREMDPINVIQKPITCTNNDERTEKVRKVEDKGSSHNQEEKDGEENIGQPKDKTENVSEKIIPSTSHGRSETIKETQDDESAQNSNKDNAKITSADGNMSGNDEINDSSGQSADGTSGIENIVDSFESTSATSANSQEESSSSEPENIIIRKGKKKRKRRTP